jgi:mono/diheme cytochrome c family protein
VIAFNRASGAIAWQGQLPAGTNATVAIVGDTLLTAASYPQAKDQKAEIIALRVGTSPRLPAEGSASTGTGSGGGGSSGAPDQGGSQAGGSTATAQQIAAGKKVFTSNCGGCHTLADAGTSGSVGPNLDELSPDTATVEQQVRSGGGGMPAFDGSLSDEQIADVSAYVSAKANPDAAAGGGGSGP